MMRSAIAAAAALCLAIAVPAAAQTAGSNTETATLGWYGVQATFRDDPSVEGGKALRVEVPGKATNPWDGGVVAKLERPLRAGDEVVLSFWARLEQGENGAATAAIPNASVGLGGPPWTTVASAPVEVSKQWKRYEVRGKADRDYAAGSLGVGIQLATAKQVIDFGPVAVATVAAGAAGAPKPAALPAAAPARAKPGSLASLDPAKIPSMIINDPGAPSVNGAKAKLVDDERVSGGKALRVQVSGKGKNAWDSSLASPITKPVKAGDNLLLVFWARLEQGEKGATTTTLPWNSIGMTSDPWTPVVGQSADIGPEWKQFEISGKAERDFAPGTLGVSLQLATAKQTVDLGPVIVLNLGQ